MSVYHGGLMVSGLSSAKGGTREKLVLVNSEQVRHLRRIHFETPVPSFCRKLMMEILFKEDLKIIKGKKVMGSSDIQSSFRQMLERDYVPFLQDVFDELMIVGICVVTFVKNGLGQKVPSVVSSEALGIIYEIRIQMDMRTGKPKYVPYWLVNKKGEILDEPKKARQTFVFDSVVSGPSITGALRSPLAPLSKQELYFEQMVQMDRVAHFNMSDPSVITVAPHTDTATASLELGTPSYSAKDAIADMQGMYAQDAANVEHMQDQMKIQGGDEWYPDGSHMLKKQLHGNIKVFPMGNAVVSNMPQPHLRGDYVELVKQYYTIVCAAYGLDIRYIFSDGSTFKTADSSTLLRDRMDMTQRLWGQRLSNVCTDVLRHTYFPEQCNLLFDTFAEIDPEASFETLIQKVDALLDDVKVVLPVPISLTIEELRTLYMEKAISWEEYFNLSRSLGGLLSREVPPEPKLELDPMGNAPGGTQAPTPSPTRQAGSKDKEKSSKDKEDSSKDKEESPKDKDKEETSKDKDKSSKDKEKDKDKSSKDKGKNKKRKATEEAGKNSGAEKPKKKAAKKD